MSQRECKEGDEQRQKSDCNCVTCSRRSDPRSGSFPTHHATSAPFVVTLSFTDQEPSLLSWLICETLSDGPVGEEVLDVTAELQQHGYHPKNNRKQKLLKMGSLCVEHITAAALGIHLSQRPLGE